MNQCTMPHGRTIDDTHEEEQPSHRPTNLVDMIAAEQYWPRGSKYDILKFRVRLKRQQIRHHWALFKLFAEPECERQFLAWSLLEELWDNYPDAEFRYYQLVEYGQFFPEEAWPYVEVKNGGFGNLLAYPECDDDWFDPFSGDVTFPCGYDPPFRPHAPGIISYGTDHLVVFFPDMVILQQGDGQGSLYFPRMDVEYEDPHLYDYIYNFLADVGFRLRGRTPHHTYGNCQLHFGDCRQVLKRLDDRPKFLFADPPFNIGQNYNGFDDDLPEEKYASFTRQWIHAAEESLADDGVMAIHVPDNVVPLVLESARLTRIAWIIWHYRFGQCGRTNWINSKAHCLVFANNPSRYTWNPDNVLVSSDRATTYKDKRTLQSATPGQRVPFDVWGIPSDGPNWGRVQGNNAERRPGHPNQLPEVYLERLIRAYTNPGDLVLDPFVGSGTTIVVAEALGRRSIGIDISLSNIDSAYERLQNRAVRIQN